MSKPIDEIRFGAVKATIWRNGTDPREHGPHFNITFSRLYPIRASATALPRWIAPSTV